MLLVFKYFVQYCFIYRPSVPTVSRMMGLNPGLLVVCIGRSTPSGYGEKSPKNAGAARGYCIAYIREFLNIQNMLGGMERGGRRTKIRLKEGNAKCFHLKKFTCKETSRQVFICLRPRTPYSTPFIYCIRVSVYLFTQGRVGGGGGLGEPVRRLEGRL